VHRIYRRKWQAIQQLDTRDTVRIGGNIKISFLFFSTSECSFSGTTFLKGINPIIGIGIDQRDKKKK
jgi:hypothetical protein